MGKRKIISKPSWLIYTEGETEKIYLNSLIRHLNLSGIITVKKIGKQHEALLDEMEMTLSKPKSSAIEKAYIIHDYDDAYKDDRKRESFNDTFQRAREGGYIDVIYSIPCFEYWILLHYDYCQSDLDQTTCQKKVLDIVNEERKKQQKNVLDLEKLKTYDYLNELNLLPGPKMERAEKYARKIFMDINNRPLPADGGLCSSIRPSTNFFEIINAIKSLKKS